MQCGELVYRKVPIMSQNPTGFTTPAMRPKKQPKETIHSGHFMVSHFEAEAQDDEDELAGAVPVPEEESAKLTVVGVTPAGINAQAFIIANKNDRANSQQLSIETSLTKLFQCMSLAYRQKLTSPKWNRFKGIRLRWKDKIRLNNVIWRCWHMQFIMRQNTLVCQFASPLDVDLHNKPEAVVLEGKYWKRRLAAVTAEYKKWRLFHRNRVIGNKDGSDVLSDMDLLDWQPTSEEGMHMLVDEDYMEFMTDTLFSTISANQPFAFPDSREIARAGLADFIQPSLGPLQPNLDDFMDTFEPLQEFICYSKLPSVPEEPSNEEVYKSNLIGMDLIQSQSTSNMQHQSTSLPDVSMISQQIIRPPQQEPPRLQVQSVEFITPDKQDDIYQQTKAQDYNSVIYQQPERYNPQQPERQNRASRSRTAKVNARQQPQMVTQNYQPEYPQYQTYQNITATREPLFKVPSPPPPLLNTQQSIMKPLRQYQDNSPDTFKMPNLPQNWDGKQQSYQQNQPVQLVQVQDLNNPSQLTDTRNTGQTFGTTSKYTSVKQRGKVRSVSVGSRQPPPPLKSSSSDPALLTNTSSVLLAQLLSNNTQAVYNFNAGPSNENKPQLLSSSVISNVKNSTNSLPTLLSMPTSNPQQSTTLVISTPLSLTNTLDAQSSQQLANTLQQNHLLLNSLTNTQSQSSSSSVINLGSSNTSPKALKTESPLSPLSPAESLGSPSLRNVDRGSGSGGENRRVGHIHAEQKRRYNIKNGFDTLHSLIPQLSQNPNAKLSKAAMLQKGAEYIKQLKLERSQIKEEMDNLKQQSECLTTSISNCQSMLPATGAPVSRQRASKMREMFDEYVRVRTQENWKFWIFSLLFEPLLTSYNSSVATSSLDDLYHSTLMWIEQHCSLVDLRPAVLNNLRILSTKTEILSDPSKLPEEARIAVETKHRLTNEQ